MTRIISVRPAPVASVLAIVYAVLGLSAYFVYAVSNAGEVTLPIGIVMPVLHLNLNIHLARSPDLLHNAFVCVAAILSYALTGWITGIVLTLCFNFVANKLGGIDAKFVSVAREAGPTKSVSG